MAKIKGNSTTNIFTEGGKKNFDNIKKDCGCALGTKCNCKVAKTK